MDESINAGDGYSFFEAFQAALLVAMQKGVVRSADEADLKRSRYSTDYFVLADSSGKPIYRVPVDRLADAIGMLRAQASAREEAERTEEARREEEESRREKESNEEFNAAVEFAEMRGLIPHGVTPSFQTSGPGRWGGMYQIRDASGSVVCEVARSSVSMRRVEDKLNRKRLECDPRRGVTEASLFGEECREQWVYMYINLDIKGMGETSEILYAFINGVAYRDYILSDSLGVMRLHELLTMAGGRGWELVSHFVEPHAGIGPGTTHHYLIMKKKKVL